MEFSEKVEICNVGRSEKLALSEEARNGIFGEG